MSIELPSISKAPELVRATTVGYERFPNSLAIRTNEPDDQNRTSAQCGVMIAQHSKPRWMRIEEAPTAMKRLRFQ